MCSVVRLSRYFPDPLPDGQFANPCIPMRFHTRPSRPPEGRVLPSLWRCCRLCRSGDAEPRAASWSRRRWPWHWYIQGRQWTPLQRAEWCAALCRTFPASAGRPAQGEFTSMAASGAAWSGSLFETLLRNAFAPPQTQASAAQCSHKLRSLSPSSRQAPLSGKASSLSASSGSLSKGFLIPLSAGDGQSLLCGRPRIDASLATRWRTS